MAMTRNKTDRGFWSDAEHRALVNLAAKGLSAARIAQELGTRTRNAVIGRCHREGVVLANPPGGSPC